MEQWIGTDKIAKKTIEMLESNGVKWKEKIKRQLIYSAAEHFVHAEEKAIKLEISFDEKWEDGPFDRVLTIRAIVRG